MLKIGDTVKCDGRDWLDQNKNPHIIEKISQCPSRMHDNDGCNNCQGQIKFTNGEGGIVHDGCFGNGLGYYLVKTSDKWTKFVENLKDG